MKLPLALNTLPNDLGTTEITTNTSNVETSNSNFDSVITSNSSDNNAHASSKISKTTESVKKTGQEHPTIGSFSDRTKDYKIVTDSKARNIVMETRDNRNVGKIIVNQWWMVCGAFDAQALLVS